ncbi:UNVERIFIED_CONTAM: hypothetical protein NCL1_28628 [Trichonephila clavipes]
MSMQGTTPVRTTRIMIFCLRECLPSHSQHDQTVPGKKGAVQNEHPPFSPDLNPSEFFLFLRLKLALKGKRFDNISDKHDEAFALHLKKFLANFQDMYSRSQWCIVMGGDYFEGQHVLQHGFILADLGINLLKFNEKNYLSFSAKNKQSNFIIRRHFQGKKSYYYTPNAKPYQN